ncbi:MAG: hypothetical protein ACK41V_22140 [Acidovorax sp.]|uniref:hypothetical protein n=1 Tax=Acidovorax sp. TaxID=1872122 RepID=UPI00391955D4
MTTAQKLFDQVIAHGSCDRSLLLQFIDLNRLNSIVDTSPFCEIQQHPLGFLCVKWTLDSTHSLRMHIWSKQFHWHQVPNWQIHDHTFSFRSVVLTGTIQNKTYRLTNEINEGRDVGIYRINYSNQKSHLVPTGEKAKIQIENSSIQLQDSTYSLPCEVLHRSVLRSEYAITLLATVQSQTTLPGVGPRVIGTTTQNQYAFDRKIDSKVDLRLQMKTAAFEIGNAIRRSY